MIPEKSDVMVPAGGFFTYIGFPHQLPSAAVIAQRAREEYNLIFAYGDMFIIRGDETSKQRSCEGFGNCARLCWAWHESEKIQEGIERLAKLLKTMLAESNST